MYYRTTLTLTGITLVTSILAAGTMPGFASSSEVQHLRPANIKYLSRRSIIGTKKLSIWLVAEASKYEDVRRCHWPVSDWNNPDTGHKECMYVIKYVRHYEELADIICKHNALTNMATGELIRGPLGDTTIDDDFIDELEATVGGRNSVTGWHFNQPCQSGSPYDKDNRGHNYFNGVLERVLRKLKHVYRDRG